MRQTLRRLMTAWYIQTAPTIATIMLYVLKPATGGATKAEQETADKRTNDAENDVQNDAPDTVVDDFASNEAASQSAY